MVLQRNLPKKPKILIVEDEIITAHHLQRTLTALGYEVVGIAGTGAAALDQVAAAKPDLLLADIGLEGDIDGVDVATRAREAGNVPTVFLTAYSDPQTMRRARVTEPYGYLVKPFAEQELQATIEIALQQSGLAADRDQRVQAATDLLIQTKEGLRTATARLFSAQEEERQRIARDLHDDVAQRLTLLEMDIERIRENLPAEIRDRTKREFQTVTARFDELANDLRDLSHSLHPSVLDHLGLTVALRQLCKEFQSRHSLPTHFSARSVPADIPPPISLALYRIVQEALQNVAKHAGPASVNVALIGGNARLELSIRDTGAGFDLKARKNGTSLGLISMAERAEFAGGAFKVRSQPNNGTRIHVSVPLTRADTVPESDAES